MITLGESLLVPGEMFSGELHGNVLG